MKDDMTHMEAVFVPIDRDKPCLPYDEFIVDGGRHPIGGDMESKVGGHYYARYEFPNGRAVSVVCGQLFYSTIDAPYEVRLDGEDPEGYQTDEELMILLAKAIGDIDEKDMGSPTTDARKGKGNNQTNQESNNGI
jgi:hypothetical protein